MYLKVNTPEGVIFEWNVEELVIPTQAWEIGILPGHIPLVSVVKPGIAKIKSKDIQNKSEFIWEEDFLNITVGKWLLFTDGKNILVTVSKSVVKPEQSMEILEKMKKDLEEEIKKLQAKGEIEDIDKALTMLQTIEAEIKLLKKKGLL